MKKVINSSKGVTIISLVVTIIILIILAGVSISAIVNDDGIVNEANKAKQQAEIASEEEEIILAFNRVKLRKVNDGETSKVLPEELKAELIKKELDVEDVVYATGDTDLLVKMRNGNEHIINQNGKIVGIYGTSQDVTPTPQKYFSYTVNTSNNTATITKINLNAGTATYGSTVQSYKTVILDEENNYITDIVIPSEIIDNGTTYKVTAIGASAFMMGTSTSYAISDSLVLDKGITSIRIPNTVTSIGNNAFAGCKELTNVVIPNSVTSLGQYAFAGCKKLTGLTLSENISTLNTHVFDACKGLVTVNLPNKLTSIGTYAFYNCTSLIDMNIPNTVTSINSYAFQGCSNLKKVSMPNKLTSIGSYAFRYCYALADITIPNSVTTINTYAFRDCDGITSIKIPSSVTTISSYAFYNCNLLTDIYCEATSKPSGWNTYWNSGCSATVHWKQMASIGIELSDLKVGDYIKYDTGVTSVGTNGVLTCRVLYPASSQYGLQIISNTILGYAGFGAESGGAEEAVNSYNEAITTLNNFATQYLNTKYATDARSVGSNPLNKNYENTTTDVNFYNSYRLNIKGADSNYLTDWSAMQTYSMYYIDGDYWLASRISSSNETWNGSILYYDNVGYYQSTYNPGAFLACVGKINDGTNIPYLQCINILSDGINIGYVQKGVRPCITLKTTGVKITSGDGKTELTAYTLGL